jgi:cell division protein FtsB
MIRSDTRPANPKILRTALYVLGALLLLLQYPLWFGNGGAYVVWQLKREIAQQEAENAKLRERNAAMAAEVDDLKQGSAAIEERARTELGMVKSGETFYQVIDPNAGSKPANPVVKKTATP